MKLDRRLKIWSMAVLIGLLLGPVVGATPLVLAQETGPNLLTNGDFEQGAGEAWPFQDGIPEVQVAPGWRAYWRNERPSYVTVPNVCSQEEQDARTCLWARPEFRGMSTAEFDYRVHGGSLSQKYFTFNKQHEAGIYQTVSGIEPGSLLRFTIHAQTWSCLAEGEWNNCPTLPNSNNPAPFHNKVGIDPTGGVDPWSPNIVWSGEFETHDTWTAFWVEAVAEAETVTVFFYSLADWPDTFPRLNNDVYLDDASLVVVGEVTPTAPPPPPTSEVPPTPRATATPLPGGAVVHTVTSGDTLFGIALQYNVDVDELRRLNAGSLGPNDMLSVGQELVISGEPVAAATPTPVPTEAQPITPTLTTEAPQPEATQEADTGSVCVLAYNDQNEDLIYQTSSESMIPNVTLSLVGTNGPAGSYTTDGLNEPYCFQNLQPGNYVLRQSPAPGYTPSGPGEQGILLSPGQAYTVQVGYVRDGDSAAAPPEEATSDPTETNNSQNSNGNLLTTIVRVSGIVALLLAIAVGVLFVLSRR
jgi:LysM repeat protein